MNAYDCLLATVLPAFDAATGRRSDWGWYHARRRNFTGVDPCKVIFEHSLVAPAEPDLSWNLAADEGEILPLWIDERRVAETPGWRRLAGALGRIKGSEKTCRKLVRQLWLEFDRDGGDDAVPSMFFDSEANGAGGLEAEDLSHDCLEFVSNLCEEVEAPAADIRKALERLRTSLPSGSQIFTFGLMFGREGCPRFRIGMRRLALECLDPLLKTLGMTEARSGREVGTLLALPPTAQVMLQLEVVAGGFSRRLGIEVPGFTARQGQAEAAVARLRAWDHQLAPYFAPGGSAERLVTTWIGTTSDGPPSQAPIERGVSHFKACFDEGVMSDFKAYLFAVSGRLN